MQKEPRNNYGWEVAGILLLIVVVAFALSSCASRHYPQSRPKFGDSTTPIGPNKSHFRKP